MQNVFAQTKITGVVKDDKGNTLPSVSIVVKGGKGGQTDNNGKFSIEAPADATLIITYIGYIKQEIKLNGKTTINVVMEESQTTLNDVVVIGYQKVTRKKTTAAISSISAKEIANLPASSFDQLLQGRLSGVNVQNFSGMPGATPTVSVRGNSTVNSSYNEFSVVNSPLYVVDGVPQPTESYVGPGTGTGNNYLAGINPNDIESVDVLKDASAAAIYGSRAANGVILITTKKGLNTEPKVMISGYTGITQKPKLRDVTLGSAERSQKMDILRAQLDYASQKNLPYMLTDSLNPAFNGNTNWQDMFYQTGKIKDVDLSLSGGGTGGTTYRFSSGYYDEEGIIKATGFKRYTMRLNLLTKALKERLTINPIVGYSRSERARGNGDNASPISLGAGNMPSSLFELSQTKKDFYLGAYNANSDQNVSNQFTFNLNIGYDITKNFKFTSQSSFLNNSARRDQSQSSLLRNNTGNYSYSYADNGITALTSNYFTYSNSFGKHNISLIGGQDIQYDQFRYTTASGTNGASDQITVVQGFLQSNIFGYSDYQASGLLSYYGRAAYDYDSKYLLSVSTRTDGSSRFGKNSKWGFFPSASVAWIISEENFMKDGGSPFTLLKLRGSIGATGSLPGTNYLQYNLYNVNAGDYAGSNGSSSYGGVTAVTPNFINGVAQAGLTWERSTQWNVGTDVEIDNGRYSMALDFYNKESSMQLFSVRLPVTTGYDNALTNSIGVRNAGVDLSITANLLPKTSAIKWFSRLNVSYNKNTIMNLPNGGRDLVLSGDRFDKSHILSVGSPINTFYLYKTLGVYKTDADVPVNPYTGDRMSAGGNAYRAGDFQLADMDGDYLIDPFNDGINPDKLPIGDPNPKWTGGFTNNFTWKNFTVGVFCTFTFDRDVLNIFRSDLMSNSSSGSPSNFAAYSTPDFSKINIWRRPGDVAEYAKVDIGNYRYYYTSAQTFFLEKGGYFRIKSINLSYDLPSTVTKKLGLGRVRVFGVADNVAMFQQSQYLPDAEAVNPYGEYNGAGYPIPKKYTVGLEVNF
ncbi:TonB-dependent receptor [Mucilaginibacter gynuensis]|uniref:TonB-dependent receptor n=2 Tax=Mucilaginibacter gynuensis TaxID=1302236 RepID=A0ABP8GDN4_9SPHI